MRVAPREIFHPDAGAAAHAKMLQHAVIDESERHAVAGRQQEDQPAISPRLAAIFLLGPVAGAVARPVDDVGLHPDREITVIGALHRAPAEITVVAFARHIHVDARPVHGAADRKLPECVFLHPDAVRHGEQGGYVVIVDDQHGGLQCGEPRLSLRTGRRNREATQSRSDTIAKRHNPGQRSVATAASTAACRNATTSAP
jgi:hypothetical protein